MIRYWCLNGCGKSVYSTFKIVHIYNGKDREEIKRLIVCRRCGKQYLKLTHTTIVKPIEEIINKREYKVID